MDTDDLLDQLEGGLDESPAPAQPPPLELDEDDFPLSQPADGGAAAAAATGDRKATSAAAAQASQLPSSWRSPTPPPPSQQLSLPLSPPPEASIPPVASPPPAPSSGPAPMELCSHSGIPAVEASPEPEPAPAAARGRQSSQAAEDDGGDDAEAMMASMLDEMLGEEARPTQQPARARRDSAAPPSGSRASAAAAGAAPTRAAESTPAVPAASSQVAYASQSSSQALPGWSSRSKRFRVDEDAHSSQLDASPPPRENILNASSRSSAAAGPVRVSLKDLLSQSTVRTPAAAAAAAPPPPAASARNERQSARAAAPAAAAAAAEAERVRRSHAASSAALSAASSSAAAAAAPARSAPDSPMSPVPANDDADDSVGDSSSVLSRLAATERSARVRASAAEESAEPLLLSDGSLTADRSSGLRCCVPVSISARLRPYQRDGVRWLFGRWKNQEGGILGDEMGLGKTIQCIAFFAALFSMKRVAGEPAVAAAAASSAGAAGAGRDRKLPVLLIAPATILLQWQQEIKEWCPGLIVKVMHGADKTSALEAAQRRNVHVLITSYETAQNQMHGLRQIEWSLAVLNEVHRLKNPEIKSTLTFRNELPCRLKIGLTGTAVQNNYLELWCLFDVLLYKGHAGEEITPAKLKAIMKERDKELDVWKKKFNTPIKLGNRFGAPLGAIHLKDKRIAELNEWLSTRMLRREKQIIAHQLPKKEDNVVFCRMSAMQVRCYRRLLESPDIQSILNGEVDESGIMWQSYGDHWGGNQCATCPYCLVLPAMSWLNKVSNHLALLQLEHQSGDRQEEYDRAKRAGNEAAAQIALQALQRAPVGSQDTDGGPETPWQQANRNDAILKRERQRQLAQLALGDDAEALGGIYRPDSLASASTVETCGKLSALRSLLKLWYRESLPRCKVLLFSNSTQMLDLLQAMTVRAGYVHRRIDGSTPNKKRSQIVKEFHENESLFLLLLSTKAGGVGLNLTCANVVVIVDPSWNPAMDLQAQDRTYRIGSAPAAAKDGSSSDAQRRSAHVISLCAAAVMSQTNARRTSVWMRNMLHSYRLITAGGIEEQMYLRQVYKQQLALALLHPEVKQKRYFKGVAKIKSMQGELFGVRNLFDFRPDTGFSAKLVKRENDLEGAYKLKLDTLQKLRDRTAAAPAAAAAAAVAPAVPADDDADDTAAASPSKAAHKRPHVAEPQALLDIAADLDGDAAPRVEREQLLDEYALTFAANDASLLPAAEELAGTQTPPTSDDETAGAAADVDLASLLRDDDDDAEDDGEDGSARGASASAAAAAARPAAVARKPSGSSGQPSSASIHAALAGSGMLGRQNFQQLTKGSKMEHGISKTANKVYHSAELMLHSMGGRQGGSGPSGRASGGSTGGAKGASSATTSTAATGSRNGSAGTKRKTESSASGMSPPSKPASASACTAAIAAPAAAAAPAAVGGSSDALATLPYGASAPLSPPSSAGRVAASPPRPSLSPPPSSGSDLSARMERFAAMAARRGFASAEEFAKHIQEQNERKQNK